MQEIDKDKDWPEILNILTASKKSNRFFSIATTKPDGTPHVTPIGHVFFRHDLSAFYFDEYSETMPDNFKTNNKVCLMAVNSSPLFWLRSLYKAKFQMYPAVRLLGTVGERRDASVEELDQLKRSISVTARLKGHKLLWSHLSMVRDIEFTSFSYARYPFMCEGLS